MREDLTFIAVVLDESGSMGVTAPQTRAGFNEFMDAQRKVPGTCRVTLQKFSSNVPLPTFIDRDVREVPALDDFNYAPNGGTALFDALGSTIDVLGRRLALMAEADRPGKVIVVVMTDGEENSSTQYSMKAIRNRVQHQTNVYNWQFVFLGAGMEAFSQASMLGFRPDFSILYSSSNTKGVVGMTSENIANYRTGVTETVAYNATQRSDAVKP